MNIDNLNNAKKILETELSNNLKSTDELQSVYQTRISYLIDDLRSLIQININPTKFKKFRKLCDPDKK